MIIKNEKKIKLESKSKILVLGLIIFALVGIFNTARAQTQDPNQMGDCVIGGMDQGQITYSGCTGNGGTWTAPYTLLAPLPLMGPTFDPSSNNGDALTGYLNIMIRIFIGICAVLAVIMVVLGGIEYMGSELISSKESGKEKIINAIFGLLLALAAWLILHTINPAILSSNVQISSVTVNAVVADVDTSFTNSTPPPPGTPTPGCTAGVVTTKSGLVACASIADNINNLTAAATAAGLTISGGGFRSDADQQALRAQNCGGTANINNASAVCNPPTALPGQSLHEAGEAFDLTCNGAQITTSSPCYPWLQQNASKYGLINLPSEPWHWSINGH